MTLAAGLSVFAADSAPLAPYGNTEDVFSLVTYADKDSIYYLDYAQDFAALDILYGMGNRYNPGYRYENSSALHLIYRTVGRGQEGMDAAYNMEMRQAAGLGAFDEMSWADGYYLLALKDGLIGSQEFVQAYTQPASEFARKSEVSVQNFIRWMCIMHNIPTSPEPLPESIYVDPNYMPYYSGMYQAGIMNLTEIRDFNQWRYLSKNDLPLILKKFEKQILPRLNVELFPATVSQINESYQGETLVRTIKAGSLSIQTKTNRLEPVFSQLKNEIPVLGKGEPDTSGCIRVGEKLNVYVKDGKVLFIRVTSPANSLEYLHPSSIYRGSAYLYDYTHHMLVLDNAKMVGNTEKNIYGYQAFYLGGDAAVYYNGEPVAFNSLNTFLSDRTCTVYVNYDYAGGLERVEKIVVE